VKLSLARRNDAIMAGLALTVIVVDQLTKLWIVHYFGVPEGRAPISLVGPILTLDYIQNTGVAFSLLEGQSVLFFFITIAVVVIGTLYWRLRETGSLALKATFGLILGGAVGNLIDRFRHAYVVDFVHFQIPGHFNFAVFNFADSAITLGVIALALLFWRGTPVTGAGPSRGASGAPDTSTETDAPAPRDDAAARSASQRDRLALSESASPPRSAAAPRVRNPWARVK
jgi:signal peptidase II